MGVLGCHSRKNFEKLFCRVLTADNVASMASPIKIKKEVKGGKKTCKVKEELKLNLDVKCTWDLVSVLADEVKCDRRVIQNVVTLLDNDNTIPFIARYRKEQTNSMEPEKLRDVKDHLDELRSVQHVIMFTRRN